MDWTYAKLSAPLALSVLVLAGVYSLSVKTLGLIVQYFGGGLAIVVIALHIIGGSYFVLVRGLSKLRSMLWGDTLERYLDDDESVSAEDVPHWSRLWLSYVLTLLHEWSKGNFEWASFKDYHEDMVEPLVDDYQEWSWETRNTVSRADES